MLTMWVGYGGCGMIMMCVWCDHDLSGMLTIGGCGMVTIWWVGVACLWYDG